MKTINKVVKPGSAAYVLDSWAATFPAVKDWTAIEDSGLELTTEPEFETKA
jgi:hypothetical protein